MSSSPDKSKQEVIGGAKNFWLHSETNGFDLTHPATPTSPLIYPRLPLTTRRERVTISPSKTALVIVDMQNYFLSPALGRPTDSAGLRAVDTLISTAIPACRKAGIPIVWLSWGLTDEDIENMPPTILFGFSPKRDPVVRVEGLGLDMGEVTLPDGSTVQAGRSMIRDEWNAELYPPLDEMVARDDMHVWKNRISGFWGGTNIDGVLKSRGIRTLLFAGVNTDQCVAHSMMDAYTKGWDCLMLSDGCGTSNPDFVTKFVEWECEIGWGHVLTCKQLADGVEEMQYAPGAE